LLYRIINHVVGLFSSLSQCAPDRCVTHTQSMHRQASTHLRGPSPSMQCTVRVLSATIACLPGLCAQCASPVCSAVPTRSCDRTARKNGTARASQRQSASHRTAVAQFAPAPVSSARLAAQHSTCTPSPGHGRRARCDAAPCGRDRARRARSVGCMLPTGPPGSRARTERAVPPGWGPCVSTRRRGRRAAGESAGLQ
jgi:hypothetical protein